MQQFIRGIRCNAVKSKQTVQHQQSTHSELLNHVLFITSSNTFMNNPEFYQQIHHTIYTSPMVAITEQITKEVVHGSMENVALNFMWLDTRRTCINTFRGIETINENFIEYFLDKHEQTTNNS